MKEAETKLGNTKGPKKQKPIKKFIEKLKKWIKGHMKDVEQKFGHRF